MRIMLVIPNQKMPKDCDHCPCTYDGDCMALQPSENMGTELEDGYLTRRMNWCPLIEKKPGIRILKGKE